MLNAGGTLTTALFRAMQQAIVSFGGTTLLVRQTTGNWEDALIAGGIAAAFALGFRGGVEGLSDASRQRAGDVKEADIQPKGQGTA